MDFGELKQDLYDRLGLGASTPIASTVTMVERLVNQAANRVATSQKWQWLEDDSTTLAMVNGTREYLVDPLVGDITALIDGDGIPLSQVARDTFEDFLRGDSTTAAKPLNFSYDKMDGGTRSLSVSMWPTPNEGSTITVRGFRRVAKMNSDTDVPEIPDELHYLISDQAVALLREVEESPVLEMAMVRAGQATQSVVAAGEAGKTEDKT